MGTSNFTVQVADGSSNTDIQALSITINAVSVPTITTTSLLDGTVSTTYSQTISATGGVTPYIWSIASGSLPAGLSLNSSTGVISGTPTSAGTSNFTVQVTDNNSNTDTQALSITINATISPTITTTTLPDVTEGTSYSQTLSATGGTTPYTWSIASGTLPAGLSLNSSTGEISGTTTTAGTSNFTVQVTDNNSNTDTQALSITVIAIDTTTPTGTDVTVAPTTDTTLTFDDVTSGGDTTVTTSGTGTPPPLGFRLGSPPVYYEISTTATFTGNVEICINYDETQFPNENSLKLFHRTGGNWVNVTTSLNTTTDIICGDVTSFSEFVVVEEEATLIDLVSFTATEVNGEVVLDWVTASEIDNAGFNIWRKEGNGQYEKINSALIPANGNLTAGATYTYTDNTVAAGSTYYYRLEDIDTSGVSTFHDETDGIQVTAIGSDNESGASAGGGGGCFIATAAYGSYLDPHVNILREFRDEYLLKDMRLEVGGLRLKIPNILGKTFVDFYYRTSPPIADFIAEHEILRSITRVLLLPLIGFGAFLVKTTLVQKMLVMVVLLTLLTGISFTVRRRKRIEG